MGNTHSRAQPCYNCILFLRSSQKLLSTVAGSDHHAAIDLVAASAVGGEQGASASIGIGVPWRKRSGRFVGGTRVGHLTPPADAEISSDASPCREGMLISGAISTARRTTQHLTVVPRE
jgi:hypothetical protein